MTTEHHEDNELPPAGNPAETSNKGVPPAIAKFVESFYQISDTPDVHEQYADDYYIHDEDRLSFQIGPMQPTNKREGIVAWRQKGWEGVTRRKHVVNGIFISPKWENEIMLDGTVEMDKNGSTLKFNWAGRMVFDQTSLDEGSPKIETYKVWLVSDDTCAYGRRPQLVKGRLHHCLLSEHVMRLTPCSLCSVVPHVAISRSVAEPRVRIEVTTRSGSDIEGRHVHVARVTTRKLFKAGRLTRLGHARGCRLSVRCSFSQSKCVCRAYYGYVDRSSAFELVGAGAQLSFRRCE